MIGSSYNIVSKVIPGNSIDSMSCIDIVEALGCFILVVAILGVIHYFFDKALEE